MKILHVVAGVWKDSGGIAEFVLGCSREQVQLGHEVTLTFLSGDLHDGLEAAKKAGVRVVVFRRSFPRFLFFSWDMLLGLGSLVRKADVVHVHSNWTFPVWLASSLALRYKKRLVMSPHGCYDPVRLKYHAWRKKITACLFDRRLAKRSNVIHILTRQEKRDAEVFLHIRKQENTPKFTVVPCGIDFPQKRLAEESRTSKLVVSLGRLHPLKGLDLLLCAWEKRITNNRDASLDGKIAQSWKLVIVGPDQHGTRNELSRLAQTLGLKVEEKLPSAIGCAGWETCDADVIFIGVVQGDEKWSLLTSADVFVLPSRTENFGIVVGEALACGVPVVMTDVGPWKTEMERYFDAGESVPIQFEETSVSGIAEGLSKIMALDDKARTEMGRNGCAWVRREFQWKRVAERMIEAYAD